MEANPDTARAGHIPRMDVMRAVACLMVFAQHFFVIFPGWSFPWRGVFRDFTGWQGADFLLSPIVFGWLGVALFFVISGFCIHLSVLNFGARYSHGKFFERRFFRIYPAYLVNLLVCLALTPWLPTAYLNGWQVVSHLFLVHNLVKATIFGINGVAWSLGVEWQFYLLVPLLLWGRKRWGLEKCLCATLAINLAYQAYLSAMKPLPGTPITVVWSFPLITWCDWVLGACLAEAFVKGRRLFPHNGAMLAGSFLLLVAALNLKPLSVQAFLISSVFFTALMDRYLAARAPLAWLEKLLIPAGLVSYSIYLWHEPVIFLFRRYGNAHGWPATPAFQWLVYLPLSALVTLALSFASYRWIEVGVPRAWKRLFPRDTAAVGHSLANPLAPPYK